MSQSYCCSRCFSIQRSAQSTERDSIYVGFKHIQSQHTVVSVWQRVEGQIWFAWLAHQKDKQQACLHQTDGQNMACSAHSLAQTDHAPAGHAGLHRHVADPQSTAGCTDLSPMIRAKAAHTDRPPTSRAQSWAFSQAAHQQSTILCIKADR